MNLLRIICISFLILGCSKAPVEEDSGPKPEKETSVKTMTYNIWGARSGGIPDLEEIAAVIRRYDPDLVALQEVDKFTDRNSKHGDVAKELAKLTGMDFYFAKAINIQGGEYGDAVLSKLPIKEKKAYNLGVTPELGGEIRSVARITVEKGDKEFYFISTHFDHLVNEANRLKQAKDFVQILKGFDKPVIVGADFNARPDTETIKILRQHLILGCLNANCSQYTFPTPHSYNSEPDRTIDYLMYAPLDAISVKSYSVYTWADRESDHFPVVATFNIIGNKP